MRDQSAPELFKSSDPFPSLSHHARLRQSHRQGGVSALAADERWHWHAYDYGWRRVALGDVTDVSPVDPQRVWFDADLVEVAERYWRARW